MGNPINLITGNKFHQEVDFQHDSLTRLAAVRTYNSQVAYYAAKAASFGRFGSIWRSNLDRRLHPHISVRSDGTFRVYKVYAVSADGEELAFNYSSVNKRFDPMYWSRSRGKWLAGRKGTHRQMFLVGNQFELVSRDGMRERYSLGGRLLWIDYREGYRLTLAYDANGNNTSVSDSFGNAIEFTYGEDGLVTAMTDPAGRITRFTYRYAGFHQELFGEGSFATTHFTHVIDTVIHPDDTPEELTDNPVKRYLYEDARFPWALTGIIDENGDRFSTYAYDAQGRAISSEHAGGDGKITIVYDDAGDTRTVTNALGKKAVYHLAPFQDILKVRRIEGRPSVNCVAANSTFEYDTNGYIRKVTDGQGNVTTYNRDTLGQELSRTEGAGSAEERSFTTAWHETFRQPVSITGPRRRETLAYDGRGRLSRRSETDLTTHTEPYSTSGQTRTWKYTYTSQGLLDTIDGPLPGPTDTVDYEYGPAGSLKRVINAVGHVTTIQAVDGAGRPLSVQAPNGIVTNLSYDSRGRLASVTNAAGVAGEEAVTRFEYDAAGNLESITRPDGSRLTYEYDAAHRVAAVETGAGERIEYELNHLGQITKIDTRNAGGLLTTTMSRTYDELGRLLKDIGANQQTTLYSYDLADRMTGMTDALRRDHGYAYDALGRVIRETDPDGFETLFRHEENDALAGVTDARSLPTTYVTNGFGEVIRRVSPDSGTTDFWRDEAGRVIRQVDARGVETRFTYDAQDRLSSITFPASPSENRTFTYDEPAVPHSVGFLTGVNDQAGHTVFGYDARGNLTLDGQTRGTTVYETRYSYDLADQLSSITYPSGRIASYLRDAQGRIIAVTIRRNQRAPEATVVDGITYLPFGPVSRLVFGNGLESQRDYDLDGHLRHIRLTGPGRMLLDRQLTYDDVGNITLITDQANPANSEAFGYDSLDRLTGATGPYGAFAYTYDAVGNRITQTIDRGNGVEMELSILDPSSNRLLSVSSGEPRGIERLADGSEFVDFACWSAMASGDRASNACSSRANRSRTFTYSANGNMTGDVETGSRSATFVYNHANRLSQVVRDGKPLASYTYDTYERRVIRTLAGGGTVHYHYAPDGRLLAETDDHGTTLREILWLDDLPLAFVFPSQEIIFLHTDHIGRPVLATNAEGSPIWAGTFEPFGKLHATTGKLRQDLRFPGQVEDAETGLFYNWHRTYDPSTGRYLESDPIGIHGGINTFVYADGNPVIFYDQMGLKVLECERINDTWLYHELDLNFRHRWLKTSSKEAGVHLGIGLSRWFIRSVVTDHSGKSEKPGVTCVEHENVNEDCVNRRLEMGRDHGPYGPTHCVTFVWMTLIQCRSDQSQSLQSILELQRRATSVPILLY